MRSKTREKKSGKLTSRRSVVHCLRKVPLTNVNAHVSYGADMREIIDELADLHNINLDNATVTIIDGMIIFEEQLDPSMWYGVELEDYGLTSALARGANPPTQRAPGNRWDFAGEARNSTLFTNRYLSGFSSYGIDVVNRSGNTSTVWMFDLL